MATIDWKLGPFSTGGCASVVDRTGRLIGILAGGAAGQADSKDVTYLTPRYWLIGDIQRRVPAMHLL